MLVFALAFSIFPVQANAQSNKTQSASHKNEPHSPAPPVATQQGNGPDLQGEGSNHVTANVRIVSTPQKDGYDIAAFWANITLAALGVGGIVVAVCTLCILRRQTKASWIAAKAALKQSNHMIASERAWMAVQIGQPSFNEVMSPHLMPDSAHLSVVVLVTNEGKTPATVTQTWIDSFSEETVDSKDVPPVPKLPNHPDQMGSTKPITKRVASVYVPKQQFHLGCSIPKRELTKENIAWRSGAKCLCIIGFVKYIDAFNVPRITRFCFSYQALRGVPLINQKAGQPVLPPEFVRDGPDIYNEMT
jgi:hypothetical protein